MPLEDEISSSSESDSDSDSDSESSTSSSSSSSSETKLIVKKEDDDEEEVEEEVDEVEEDEDEEEEDDEGLVGGKTIVKNIKNTIGGTIEGEDDDEDDEDEEMNDGYLQKFNADINRQYLLDFHPEAMIHNYDEINALTTVVRDENNNIIDKLHRTLPYLTKYERARVLGQRAKQINSGAKAFVKVPDNTIDGYLVAELELVQKRIPFIIRRPIPGGACEYWKLKDLEIIGF
jgi:DNA-directed RNA polymerase I, II, and III subunit RPABC2